MKKTSWKAHGKEGEATIHADVRDEEAKKIARSLSIRELRNKMFEPDPESDGFVITHVNVRYHYSRR